MDIYIQRSFGGCSAFLNYLSSPFIERRLCREFLDIPSFIERRPYRDFFLCPFKHYMWVDGYIYTYIYTALLWRLLNFSRLPLFSLHRTASLSRIFGYSSLHWKASLSRIFRHSLSSSLKGVTIANFWKCILHWKASLSLCLRWFACVFCSSSFV